MSSGASRVAGNSFEQPDVRASSWSSAMDYIPGVSTIKNLFAITLKTMNFLNIIKIDPNSYAFSRPIAQQVIGLVPLVGNIVLMYLDSRKSTKKDDNNHISSPQTEEDDFDYLSSVQSAIAGQFETEAEQYPVRHEDTDSDSKNNK